MFKTETQIQQLYVESLQAKSSFLAISENGVNIAQDIIFYHGNELLPAHSNRISPKRKSEHQRTQNHTKELLEAVFKFTTQSSAKISLSNPIVDSRYREVCFWSVENIPLQLYPWLSTPKGTAMVVPLVIKHFVLASCLFGGSLRGVDQHGRYYPIIDHKLHVEDTITHIQTDEALHPYELMIFSALPILFQIMLKVTPGQDIAVTYHLPVIDYMFYGIQLYITGKLSYTALEMYVEAVKKRGLLHETIITALAKEFKIPIKVESPFNNLFQKNENITAKKILEKLSINNEKEENNLSEEAVVEMLLRQLTENNHFPDHKETWEKIIASKKISRFSPLEQLFQTANMAMIANAFINTKKDFTVCSILPIDEKPIALSYNKLLSETFGKIVSLSWLPPLLNYCNVEPDSFQNSKNKDNLFRFRPDLFQLNIHALQNELNQLLGQSYDFLNAQLPSRQKTKPSLSVSPFFQKANGHEWQIGSSMSMAL